MFLWNFVIILTYKITCNTVEPKIPEELICGSSIKVEEKYAVLEYLTIVFSNSDMFMGLDYS